MKIAVVGASGQTGPCIIREALTRGHDVIAICRSPEKMSISDPKVEVRQADAYDADAILKALDGADVVVTTVGATSLSEKGPLSTAAHRNVLDAMKAHGQDRLIAISSFGAAQGDPPQDLFVDPPQVLPGHDADGRNGFRRIPRSNRFAGAKFAQSRPLRQLYHHGRQHVTERPGAFA